MSEINRRLQQNAANKPSSTMTRPDGDKIEQSRILDEFSELRSAYFQPLHQKMIHSENLKKMIVSNTRSCSYDQEFVIWTTGRRKLVLERKFNELLLTFFAMSRDRTTGKFELFTKNGVDLEALKVSFRTLKNDIDLLNHQLDKFATKLVNPRFYSYESLGTGDVGGTDDIRSSYLGNRSYISAVKLSKKLEMIRFYLNQECVSTSSLKDSLKKSSGKEYNGESDQERENKDEVDYFWVNTFEELEEKIVDVIMVEKRVEFERSRNDGKKSFTEWLRQCDDPSEAEYWKTFYQIQDVAKGVGILLSLLLSDFLFVVSERQKAVKQYEMYFKAIVEYLLAFDEQNSTVMENIVSVLDLAESELLKIGKLAYIELDHWNTKDDDDNGYQDVMSLDQEEEIDEFLDTFLRKVLWLESVWCDPLSLPESENIILNEDLMNLEYVLEEGKENIEDLRSIVHYSRTMQYHQLIHENHEDILKAPYQKVMELNITEIWEENINQMDNLVL